MITYHQLKEEDSVFTLNGFQSVFSQSFFFMKTKKKPLNQIPVNPPSYYSVGYYVQPTIVLTTDPQCKLLHEEIFGPVLAVYVFEDADWDETVRLVDSTSPYGLTGSIFCRDR